ncbi:MAG TPA: SHOCT domain-containing protein [Ilumatobacteraceae bacterium]|nr:SHOCT domain-containing protein [Ilumatobacteraceae bacterium]
MLAYDFPILGLFWTFMFWFLWIAWILLLFRVILDIFRSRDLGGVGKAFWALFVIVLPWLGVLVYLVARGGKMVERDVEEAVAREDALQAYIRRTAGSASTADELSKLSALQAQGVITDTEFEQQKAKLLA